MSGQRDAKRILILEEDENLREMLIFVLEDEGYAVRGAGSAPEAWQAMRVWPYHLLLSADQVGSLDGIKCLKAFKERFPQLKCLALVGRIRELSASADWRGSEDGVLYKPLDLASLQLAVSHALFGEQQNLFGRLRASFRLIWERIRSCWRRGQLAAANRWRERCFKEYFNQVRSGRLPLGGAMLAWDELEELDSASASAMHSGVSGISLADGYRYLCEFLSSSTCSSWRYWPSQRRENAVDCKMFACFFQRLRCGELSLTQLRQAPALRRAGKELQNSSLFLSVWGMPQAEHTPWERARLAFENGTGIWASKQKKS